MREIVIANVENEQCKRLFLLFFSIIERSIKIKERSKTRLSKFIERLPKINSNISFQTLLDNQNNIQFEHFDFFIKKIRSLEKNPVYLDTLEWKILGFLSGDMVSTKNPTSKIKALEYLDGAGFLREDKFCATHMAAVIYCLSQPESLSVAQMLVRLDALNLLTEQNLGKMNARPQTQSCFLPKILSKLNLVGENATNHLLTQANLDKLLQNSTFNLEVLSEFIQAEDKFKVLTQEQFDLAVNLKDLLTLKNIKNIENADLEYLQLNNLCILLNQNEMLNQENIDYLMGLKKTDFERVFPVLRSLNERHLLDQDNFVKFLNTYLGACIYDEQNNELDSVKSQSSKTSLSDRLCELLTRFLSGARRNLQDIFDKIIKGFNKIIGRMIEEEPVNHSTNTPHSFFTLPAASEKSAPRASSNLFHGS